MTASNRNASTVTRTLFSPAVGSNAIAAAFPAPREADTMNSTEATSKHHPAKKPSVGLMILLTHAYAAPALACSSFKRL